LFNGGISPDDRKAYLNLFTSLLNIANCSPDHPDEKLLVPHFYDSLIRLGIQQAPANVSVGTEFLENVYLQLICPAKSGFGRSKDNKNDSQSKNLFLEKDF